MNFIKKKILINLLDHFIKESIFVAWFHGGICTCDVILLLLFLFIELVFLSYLYSYYRSTSAGVHEKPSTLTIVVSVIITLYLTGMVFSPKKSERVFLFLIISICRTFIVLNICFP